ncbi:hypothetical protein L0F63_002065, partial [Massospora cicadina]
GGSNLTYMELSGTYRLPTEETLNKPSGFAQPQGLGYAGLSFGSPSSLSEPPSDDSQISSVIKLGLSKDAAFTKAGPNCVYCGVGLSPEVLSVEWDQRVCESCYCALTYSPFRVVTNVMACNSPNHNLTTVEPIATRIGNAIVLSSTSTASDVATSSKVAT